jgi:hypothetical protein
MLYEHEPFEPTTHFRAYFNDPRNRAIGWVGHSSEADDDTETYLPDDAQIRYFSLEHIRQIRSKLYPDARGPNVGPSAYDLQGPYHQVFATLLYIGRGELIQRFVSNPDLQDTHLPFRQKPVEFPGNDEEFERFFDAQWKFCAPIMTYRQSVDWHQRQILAVECLRKLSEGDTGKAHLVRIHPSYDQILSSNATTTDTNAREDSTGSTPVSHCSPANCR